MGDPSRPAGLTMARMVPVKTCLSLPEALVASSYLHDHGVMTALNGYHHASAAWHLLFALNGIQISVLDSDLDRARALLADGSPAAVEEEQPRAGGAATPPTQFEIAIALAAFLLTGLPLPAWVRRRYF
jgi:hypothetical protein